MSTISSISSQMKAFRYCGRLLRPQQVGAAAEEHFRRRFHGHARSPALFVRFLVVGRERAGRHTLLFAVQCVQVAFGREVHVDHVGRAQAVLRVEEFAVAFHLVLRLALHRQIEDRLEQHRRLDGAEQCTQASRDSGALHLHRVRKTVQSHPAA
jgi:hypothetical protein